MSGEKTEQATDHKLSENRKKGQVSQSQDVSKLLVMLGVMEVVFAMLDDTIEKLKALMVLPTLRLNVPFEQAVNDVAGQAFLIGSVLTLLTAGTVIIVRPLAGWIQIGPLFAPEAAAPKFDALNPLPKIKQMFAVKQWLQIFISIFKAVVLSGVFMLLLRSHLQEITELSSGNLEGFMKAGVELLKIMTHTSIGVLLVFSVADFAIQKYFYLKQNRMSHEDIKQEYKQLEGDPHAKSHRKQVSHEILNGPVRRIAAKRVEEADVVMVNPTHFAVGLFYNPDETALPKVLFKAQDDEAKEVIAMAHAANKPVVRYIWLTRNLYRTTEEGEFIPRETIKSVAAIYRLIRSIEELQPGMSIEFQED
ncbi:EscU/YscU/HrcU family type III secretion system export apparatus switch protein [Pantoea sp. Al-1710]|uniref:EscU/YscU/HrcU family type III secretion system export apparatus switch protein n=1 Tax=Candidatus Pantoea communis TaxID=2608354 RepID=A0ABX0RJS5_9GAMM|nr:MULTISPECIES: type III secretion system export apparatus subunit SctU [Pantoea]NIG12940.1 EscU/YscU/HrcU family type III secretion system export apparatus switch protein [Pantoea sp. Cy-640]NIG17359.1 EscU/YscU/HrcU family type III secretion system export apparatus switch protein [Pantoea communis]